MNKYKIGIEENCYGFVWIDAKNEEEAKTKANQLIDSENILEALSRGKTDENEYETMLKEIETTVLSVESE